MDVFLIKDLLKYIEKEKEVALVTVTNKTGSGPRGNGSMMVVGKEGSLLAGTIGGGSVEERAKKDALVCIRENTSKSMHYDLTLNEGESSLQMACGGHVDIFIKVFKERDQLIIFGAGHIGMELSIFADRLGYQVVMVDERQDYANEDKYPHAYKLVAGDIETTLASLTIDENTSIVIVTHGHLHDIRVLRGVIHSPARYIGMIGSKNKVKHCFHVLEEEGIKSDRLKRVHAPIGLKIGGDTPVEIAMSIMAEVQAVKYGKDGPFMKNDLNN